MLGGIAVANYRLLDLHRLVLGNFQAGLPHSQKDHTPALGNTNAGSHILTEEQLFNGNAIGPCHPKKLGHIVVNNLQPGGKIHTRRGGDSAAVKKFVLISLRFDQPKAGNAVTRVNSQNPHCFHLRFLSL